jgi:integrase
MQFKEFATVETSRATEHQLHEVNERLKKCGGGWVGYRNGGESGQSKYLYFAFYPQPGMPQKFVNSKSNDVEDVYRQLLAARGITDRGVTVLPSEAARITYEDLRQRYIADKPDRRDPKLSRGARQMLHLDKFFAKMKALQITTGVIRQYIAKRRHAGVADPSVRRELVFLRAMFKQAGREKILSADQTPYFPMPQDSEAAGEYIPPQAFARVLEALPDGSQRGSVKGGPTSQTNLQPFFKFLYATGCRLGAAQKIRWDNVKEVNGGLIIEIPSGNTKNKRPLTLPLAGAILEPIARDLRKSFRVNGKPVFDSTNYRTEWAKACAKAGIGTWDEKARTRTGVRIHDCRASAAVNLLASGVPESTVLKIGGWKTRAMLDRYNVADVSRLTAALEKGGSFVTEMMKAAK